MMKKSLFPRLCLEYFTIELCNGSFNNLSMLRLFHLIFISTSIHSIIKFDTLVCRIGFISFNENENNLHISLCYLGEKL